MQEAVHRRTTTLASRFDDSLHTAILERLRARTTLQAQKPVEGGLLPNFD
jgi:hypothetical protein